MDALEHVVTCRLRGIEIASNAIEPATGGLDAFWQRASELGAVVFIHPWGCTLDARLNKWYIGNSVGQPVEHALALSHIIFSGVLDRHPKLKIIAAHGGGYLPRT